MINTKSINSFTLDKILVYLLCMLLVFDQSVYFLSNLKSILEILTLTVTFLLGIVSVTLGKKKVSVQKIFIFLIILIFQVTLYIISSRVYEQTGESFLLIYLFIPFMYLYFSFNSLENEDNDYFLSVLANIIVFLATFSLLIWLLVSITKTLLPNDYVLLNWGVPHYVPSFHNLYFETQNVNLGSFEYIRNTFIYPEGPIYSFVLSFALIFLVFIKEKKFTSYSVLTLVFTILSTGSSTGFIVIAGVLFLGNVIKVNDKKKALIILVLASSVLLLIAIAVILQKQTDNGRSLDVRFDDIAIGINLWLKHPITGIGFGNYLEILNQMDLTRLRFNGNTGFSSGLALITAYGGTFLLLNYMIPLLRGIVFGLRKELKYLVFSIMIFFLLATTIVQVNHIFLAGIVYLLSIDKRSI